jgi:hypothetical protein
MLIEDKLRALAECGLRLREPFGVPDLVKAWGREALDAPGFNLTLVGLGMTEEAPPWTPHCDNLWHFDAECIDGDGSYVRIAKRMEEMAQGAIPLTDIQDVVDFENGTASLRFCCRGQTVEVECKVEDDWVDFTVFERFAELLAVHEPDKVFICHDLGGQDCILGCVTREQLGKLRKLLPQVRALS